MHFVLIKELWFTSPTGIRKWPVRVEIALSLVVFLRICHINVNNIVKCLYHIMSRLVLARPYQNKLTWFKFVCYLFWNGDKMTVRLFTVISLSLLSFFKKLFLMTAVYTLWNFSGTLSWIHLLLIQIIVKNGIKLKLGWKFFKKLKYREHKL